MIWRCSSRSVFDWFWYTPLEKQSTPLCRPECHPVFHHGVRVTDDRTLAIASDCRPAQGEAGTIAVDGSAQHTAKREQDSSTGRQPGHGQTTRHSRWCGLPAQWPGTAHRRRRCANAFSNNAIALISPLGYSPAGELFSVSASEVAEHVAVAIEADKLIFLDRHEGLADGDGSLIRQSTIASAEALELADDEQRRLRDAACRACAQGVARSHVLSYSREGSLLEELFTHDGSGTLIAQNPYEQARGAEIEDIASILELIRPLEQSGALVRRSRERLEEEISHFSILERDGRVLACAALYPYRDERVGEIACVATHPDYRGAGRARQLLSELLNQAKDQSLDHVFVLTTQSTHWFLEQGFETASLEQLPVEKNDSITGSAMLRCYEELSDLNHTAVVS